jgi:SAM-dependent methyltransferase
MQAGVESTTAAEAPASGLPREHVEACGVCGAAERAPFQPNADVVECMACGALYVSPRPTAAAIAEFYSRSGHYDHWDREPGRVAMWRRRTERIAKLVPPNSLLLDVGTGQGDFGAQAKSSFRFEATEVSSEGARLARERHGLTVHEGDLLDLDLPKSHYDAITMWHVLEHVADPRKTVAKCISLLKPGGVLAVAVPNTDTKFILTRTELKAAVDVAVKRPPRRGIWMPRLLLESSTEEIHLTHFTLGTLTWLLRSSGLAIAEQGVDDFSADAAPKHRLEHHAHALFHRLTGFTAASCIFAAGRKPA